MTPADDYFDEGIFERRTVERAVCYRGGLIRFPGVSGIVSCSIRELSDHGAGIRLHTTALLPVEFDLSDDNLENTRRCRLVWRDGYFIGVEFVRRSI